MPTLKIMTINRIDFHKLSASHVIIIPIRSFFDSKSRLAMTLTDSERVSLMIKCSQSVITAAGSLPKVVVTSDPAVKDFAIRLSCHVIPDNGSGLSSSVQSAFHLLREWDVKHVTVAHADLPFAKDIGGLMVDGAITLVPDRKRDGTNIISLPANCGFQFSYGPGSFERHRQEASRLGLTINIDDCPELTLDVDTPEDLEAVLKQNDPRFKGIKTGT